MDETDYTFAVEEINKPIQSAAEIREILM